MLPIMMNLLPQQLSAKEKLQQYKVGAFFMEPGTGKTRPVVELTNEIEPDYVAYFAPFQCLNSEKESETTQFEVSKWGGFKCAHDFIGIESIQNSDRTYLDIYKKLNYAKKAVIIVDESLKIKNGEAKRTKRLLELSRLANYKLILNGTPISKNLLDLKPQMDFLSPTILNMSLSEFKNHFCEYKKMTIRKPGTWKARSKEWIVKYHNLDYLYKLIEPYIYECSLDLQIGKQYVNIDFELQEEEKERHQNILDTILNNEWLMAKPNFFLELTQKLQNNYSRSFDKFEVLGQILSKNHSSKVLVFAKYIETQEALKNKFPLVKILSYQKHSFGLNLQAYNRIVFFDKIWDYALREQAERRIFRTGQTDECIFYDLTGNVGLEKMIDKNIERKADLLQEFKKLSLEEFKKQVK